MLNKLLQIRGLTVSAEDTELLHDISFDIEKGETHVVVGAKDAGKSTLGLVLMGSPDYRITGGKIFFNGEDITGACAEARAEQGMYLAFQNPPEIPGLTLEEFLIKAMEEKNGQPVDLMRFREELDEKMWLLRLHPSIAERDLNVEFTDTEKKKTEILQLLVLSPEFAILDDVFAKLEEDDISLLCEGISSYREKSGGTLLILSQSAILPESLHVDKTHVLVRGGLDVRADGDDSIRQEKDRKVSPLNDRPEMEVM